MISPLVYGTIVLCLLGAHAATVYFMGQRINDLRDALTMRDVLLGEDARTVPMVVTPRKTFKFSVRGGDTIQLKNPDGSRVLDIISSNSTHLTVAIV